MLDGALPLTGYFPNARLSPMISRLISTLLAGLFLAGNLQAQEKPFSPGQINDAIAFLAGMEFPHQGDHPLTSSSSWTRRSTINKDEVIITCDIYTMYTTIEC